MRPGCPFGHTRCMIFDAIRQGDAARVGALLAADPTLASARTPEGASPVLWAAYTRHAELAPLLLAGRQPDFFEACALGIAVDTGDVNAFAPDGFTGLGLACFFGHIDLARRLLDLGADPNLASNNGLRVAPLHSAVTTGSAAMVELLLSRGARPNVPEANGYTPLHTAAGHGNREIIAMLLAAGADATRKAADGKTPADVAWQFGHQW
jgi:ankyrin repeat protein